MEKKFIILILSASFLAASAVLACDMEGEGHKEAKAAKTPHHEISLISAAHAGEEAGAQTAAFQVKGMMCSACYNKVNGALSKLQGVKSVKIDQKKNIVTVAYAADQTNTDAMMKAVDAVGFKATMN